MTAKNIFQFLFCVSIPLILLAYIGGDPVDVAVTAEFLRNGLNPLLAKYGVASIVNHHTPKANRIFRLLPSNAKFLPVPISVLCLSTNNTIRTPILRQIGRAHV